MTRARDTGSIFASDGSLNISTSVNLGDNEKALFGASNDLQIYHDGSNSFIREVGAGNLYIEGSSAIHIRGTNTEFLASFGENSATTLYYDGSAKLATTNTGIDVTGTVTADGLTVNGTAQIERSGASPLLQFTDTGVNSRWIGLVDGTSNFTIYGTDGLTQELTLNASGNVGIGATTVDAKMHIEVASGDADLKLEDGSGTYMRIDQNSIGGTSVIRFNTGASLVERARIDSSGNVGIGTTSPDSVLHVADGTSTALDDSRYKLKVESSGEAYISVASDTYAGIRFPDSTNVSKGYIDYYHGVDSLVFGANGSQRMRIDSSGNLLVGKTAEGVGNIGFQARPDGFLAGTRNGGTVSYLNRLTSDGEILRFQKDSSTVGSIGSFNGNAFYAGTGCGLRPRTGDISPTNASGSTNDGGVDLGTSSNRFQNIWLSGGAYLGGTATANKLDDYEEGTFSPTLRGQVTAGSSPSGSGYYTKVGDLVFVKIRFNFVTVSGASGSIQVAGLPFTVSGTDASGSISITSNLNFSSSYIQGISFSNTTTNMDTYENRSGSNPADWNITNTSNIIFVVSGCYKTS